MKNFFKKTDLPMRIFALVLAVLLWGVVMMSTTPMRTHVIKTVPGNIELEGADTLLENYNLSVIEGLDSTVAFTVEGTSSAISSLLKSISRIRVTIDVSDIDAPGEYFMHYTIKLPISSGLTVNDSYRTKTIRLVVDEVTSKAIPVSLPEAIGTPPNSYMYGTPSIGLQSVHVTGPSTILNTVSTARLSLSADGLTRTQTLVCSYVLLNADGEPVESPHLTFKPENVGVTIPVYKYADVPLDVKLHPSADITADMVKAKIEPATVKVFGSESAVDAVKVISLGDIDLSGVHNGARQTMNIQPPIGVQLMENQPTSATVTLQVDGISSKAVKISNVQLMDTSTAQPRLVSKLSNETVELTLSGKSSALAALDLSQVQVTVIFDSAAYGTGVHLVPVQITLPSDSGVTVVDEDTLQTAIVITEPTPAQNEAAERDGTNDRATAEGGEAP